MCARVRGEANSPFSAGELPKGLGKLVNLTFFNAAGNKLQGRLTSSTRAERVWCLLTLFFLLSGELPKQLPVSLEVLIFGDNFDNNNKFTGGIPSEWGALTNLKELKIALCGLDGKPLRTRAKRLVAFC